MQPRIDYLKFAPEAQRAMYGLEKYLAACGLEHKLLHLLKLRASQINGCAYCIDIHSKDARALGEPEQRLYELDAWRETPFYTDRERAALAWVESVTLVSETHVPDAVYEEVKQHFSQKEVVDLARGHHQYVEPPGHLDALRSRAVPACEILHRCLLRAAVGWVDERFCASR